jgi:hypothetical protein
MNEDRYFDRNGRQISMRQWAELMRLKHLYRRARPDGWTTPAEDPTRIGLDRVGEATVSTVWLGLDHRLGEGPPLIFETMVFGGPGDDEMERYSTEDQARAGHDQWVARERQVNQESTE